MTVDAATEDPTVDPPPRRSPAGGRGVRARARDVTALGWVGAALLAVLTVAALLASVLTPFDPQASVALPHLPPGGRHLLGTNDLGQDILTRLLHGTRLSLAIGVLSGLFATAVGLIAGLAAGYYRGAVDATVMRAVDLTLSLPFVPLVIVLAAFFGRGLLITVIVIAAVLWARPGRILRAQALKVSAYQHVDASRAMGSTSLRTIRRHVLPRTAPLAIAQFVHAATIAVLIEASLAFLGLGDPERVSWGTMLFFANASNAMLTQAWQWWVLPPGLTLTAAVLGFAFIGVAAEQWGDRRLRGGSAASAHLRRRGRVNRTSRSGPASHAGGTTVGKRAGRADGGGADGGGEAVASVMSLQVVYDTPAGSAVAVDDVTLEILPRRIVGLVGESGCGKTTLAMSLVGLVPSPGRIATGSITVAGADLVADERAASRVRGRDVSLVPQSSMNALNPAYTARRQVAEAAALTRPPTEARARADELLDLVGLSPTAGRSYPHQLSGGMRQRVVIAMALANDPKLVIADEPMTGLDLLTQHTIVELLVDLRTRLDIAILLVSHDLPLVGHVADDLVVMYAGKVVESGTATAVLEDPQHPYTQQLLRAFPTLGTRRTELAVLDGHPPDLHDPPDGCRFHPRCPQAFDDCATVVPPLYEPVPEHRAACLLHR